MMLVVGASCGGRTSLFAPSPRDAAAGGELHHDTSTDAILDPRCPPLHPQIGDSCATDQLRCNYERCLGEGTSDVTYLCVQTRFGLEGHWDCAPNPPGCPSLPPVDLSPCSLPDAICRWAPGSKAHCWASDRRWHLFAGF
jgi:hypothetical protein